MTLLAALAIGCAPEAPDDEGDDDVDGHEPTGHRDDAVITGTVNDAVAGSCATGSVKGLSLQIIAEGQCLVPDAYAALPAMPNLSLGDNDFAFLEKTRGDLTNHSAYVQSWLKAFENDPKFIFRAAAAASKATDFILDFSRPKEVEETVGELAEAA